MKLLCNFLLINCKFELGVLGKSDGLHCHIVACCMQRSVLMDMAYAELQTNIDRLFYSKP